MGKGGGCVPSKKSFLVASERKEAPMEARSPNTPATAEEVNTSLEDVPPSPAVNARKLQIFIVFYSMYGHVEKLARRMKKGVDEMEGVEGLLFRVPETLPFDVLEQMRASEKDNDIPTISAAELPAADGMLFGFPTRYGCMAAQMKAFFDSTDQLWQEQKLAGKPAGFFISTGTQGGGQETTATAGDVSWTAITQLCHHGMFFVPIGYTFGAGMFKMDDIRGGSPYGAGVFAGDGSREPSETELALAEHQGRYVAGVVKRLAAA